MPAPPDAARPSGVRATSQPHNCSFDVETTRRVTRRDPGGGPVQYRYSRSLRSVLLIRKLSRAHPLLVDHLLLKAASLCTKDSQIQQCAIYNVMRKS